MKCRLKVKRIRNFLPCTNWHFQQHSLIYVRLTCMEPKSICNSSCVTIFASMQASRNRIPCAIAPINLRFIHSFPPLNAHLIDHIHFLITSDVQINTTSQKSTTTILFHHIFCPTVTHQTGRILKHTIWLILHMKPIKP